MASFNPKTLGEPGTVYLETSAPGDRSSSSLLFTKPQQVLTSAKLADIPSLLKEVEHAIERGFHVAGYLSYEAGYAFARDLDMLKEGDSLAWLGVYNPPQTLSPAEVLDGWTAYEPGHPHGATPHLRIQEDDYLSSIQRIKELIRDGDLYQVNFTTHAQFDFAGDPVDLFQRLRTQQRVPFAAFLNLGERHILSLSPELFFRREGDSITTRPMKGTIRRGRTLEEDERLSARLAADTKSQAENLMIVDLLRNDLSRVSVPGSVRVPELFTVERYESVHQMTSTVTARLRPDVCFSDIIEALFPCGSVTGAPKLRAMQRIRQLEQDARGAYCGTIGYITPKKDATFSVAIRTVDLEDGKGKMGTGSGIVWDSDPGAEYSETKLKTRFLKDALKADAPVRPPKLIETMRWVNGGIPLFDRHMARLKGSASWIGYPLQEGEIEAKVQEACAGVSWKDPQKVRMTLDAAGRLKVSLSPIENLPDPLRVAYWSGRVDPENPYLYHKTSRRALYRTAYEEVQKRGYDEALLINTAGYVTEGTRCNIFIQKDGTWRTPPLTAGLLPGVYRSYLLETLERVEEVDITPEAVASADKLICCNALRGSMLAVVIEPQAQENRVAI